jgi:hypothetical protein
MSRFPETQRVAVASTAHITDEDNDILRRIAAFDLVTGLEPWMVAAYYGGFLIRVMMEDTDIAQLTEAVGLSNDASNLLQAAAAEGFHWLRIDCDGPELEGLPIHEWEAEEAEA